MIEPKLFGLLEGSHRSVCVPQGALVGPILFSIYFNYLPLMKRTKKYTLFADDTTVSCPADRLKGALCDSRSAQVRAEEWLYVNRLFLNQAKTG